MTEVKQRKTAEVTEAKEAKQRKQQGTYIEKGIGKADGVGARDRKRRKSGRKGKTKDWKKGIKKGKIWGI